MQLFTLLVFLTLFSFKIIMIGNSRCPWECDQKGLTQTYQKIIYLPKPDYSYRFTDLSIHHRKYVQYMTSHTSSYILHSLLLQSSHLIILTILCTLSRYSLWKELIQLYSKPSLGTACGSSYPTVFCTLYRYSLWKELFQLYSLPSPK